MSFSTEKNKFFKLWDKVESNTNIIITQKDNNNFIIDGVNELNNTNQYFPILTNFSSDFIPAEIIEEDDAIIGNFIEFKLTFRNVNEFFIPYIHGEILYKVGDSGIIPEDEGEPFDEKLAGSANGLQKGEMFQLIENLDRTIDIEYITYMRMDFDNLENEGKDGFDVEYQLVAYIFNPAYYQSST